MAQLQEKHQRWGGEGRGAGGRHLRFKDPGCSECGRVLLGPVRSGPTVAGLVLPGGQPEGLGPWPGHLQHPSLRPCRDLGICPGGAWPPEAAAGALGPHGPPFMDRPVAVRAGAVMTPRSFPSTAGVSCSLPSGCGEGVHPQPSRGQGGERAFSL